MRSGSKSAQALAKADFLSLQSKDWTVVHASRLLTAECRPLQVSEIEKRVKSIEEQRDAARKRLEALPEPRLFHPKTEEWIHAFQEVKRYEDLHTIESAALVRKLDSIKKNTTVFPVAKERAQVRDRVSSGFCFFKMWQVLFLAFSFVRKLDIVRKS
jgi:SPX domain protein involved in polyphosphate accumulation